MIYKIFTKNFNLNKKALTPVQIILASVYSMLIIGLLTSEHTNQIQIIVSGYTLHEKIVLFVLPVMYVVCASTKNLLLVKGAWGYVFKQALNVVSYFIFGLCSIILTAFYKFLQNLEILFVSKYILIKRVLTKEEFYSMVNSCKDSKILESKSVVAHYNIPTDIINSWFTAINNIPSKFSNNNITNFIDLKVSTYHYYETTGMFMRITDSLATHPWLARSILYTTVSISVGFVLRMYTSGFWSAVSSLKNYIPFMGDSLDVKNARAIISLQQDHARLLSGPLNNLVEAGMENARGLELLTGRLADHMSLYQNSMESLALESNNVNYMSIILVKLASINSYVNFGAALEPQALLTVSNILTVLTQDLINRSVSPEFSSLSMVNENGININILELTQINSDLREQLMSRLAEVEQPLSESLFPK